MVADPPMRMSWAAYAVFSKNAPYLIVSSYIVALIKLFRQIDVDNFQGQERSLR